MASGVSALIIPLITAGLGVVAGHFLAIGRDARNHFRQNADIPRKQISRAITSGRPARALDENVLDEVRGLMSLSKQKRLAVLEKEFKELEASLYKREGPYTSFSPTPEEEEKLTAILHRIQALLKSPPWWKTGS